MTVALLLAGVLAVCGAFTLLLMAMTAGPYSEFYWFAALVIGFLGVTLVGVALTPKKDRGL